MLKSRPESIQLIACASLVLAMLSCNLQFAAPASPAGPATASPQAAATSEPTSTAGSTMAPATSTQGAPGPTETSTATVGAPPVIVVRATGGRLNVRRGPGPEYDTVGALLDGQEATAAARNADKSWIQIYRPESSSLLGWVTIMTQYTSLTGEPSALPVLDVGPAIPAYIRNCTPHEMLVSPTGVVLLDRGNSPDNQVQFFPGEYTVMDQTTETQVAAITIFEGRTIEIKKDGTGKSFVCP